MSSGYSFRPRLWAVALAAAACAAGIALGSWQAGRADEKRALAANVQRIMVMGEFLPERTVFLDNKVHAHRPGYEVVTPLRLAEGIHVLVNRGWVAAPATRDRLPEVQTPRGRVRIEGVVHPHLRRVARLGVDLLAVARFADLEPHGPLVAGERVDGGLHEPEEVGLDPLAREVVGDGQDDRLVGHRTAGDLVEPGAVGGVVERLLQTVGNLVPEGLRSQLSLALHSTVPTP